MDHSDTVNLKGESTSPKVDPKPATSAATAVAAILAMPQIQSFKKDFITNKEECKKFLKKMEETVKTYVDPNAHAKITDRSLFFPAGDDRNFLESYSSKDTPAEFVVFLKKRFEIEEMSKPSADEINKAILTLCKTMLNEEAWLSKDFPEFTGAINLCVWNARKAPALKAILDQEQLIEGQIERSLNKRILESILPCIPTPLRDTWKTSLYGDQYKHEHETLTYFLRFFNNDSSIEIMFRIWKESQPSVVKRKEKSGKKEDIFCSHCDVMTNHSEETCWKAHPELAKSKAKKGEAAKTKVGNESTQQKSEQPKEPSRAKESGTVKTGEKAAAGSKSAKPAGCFRCGDLGHRIADCKASVVGALQLSVPNNVKFEEQKSFQRKRTDVFSPR